MDYYTVRNNGKLVEKISVYSNGDKLARGADNNILWRYSNNSNVYRDSKGRYIR